MSDLCAGIIFNETDQKCNLRSNDIYNEKRIIDDKNKIYLRTKSIDNDVTCPSNINDYTYLSTLDWADFNKNNTDMNYDTKCGLAHFTQTERGNMDSSYNNLKQVLHNDAKEKIQALDGSYNILSNNLKNTKKTLNNKSKLKLKNQYYQLI